MLLGDLRWPEEDRRALLTIGFSVVALYAVAMAVRVYERRYYIFLPD